MSTRMALLVDGPRAGEWVDAPGWSVRAVDPMEPLGPLFAVEETDSIEIPMPRIRDYRIERVALGGWDVWVGVSEYLSSGEHAKAILRAVLQRDVFARLERAR